jgi:hypothetical protein
MPKERRKTSSNFILASKTECISVIDATRKALGTLILLRLSPLTETISHRFDFQKKLGDLGADIESVSAISRPPPRAPADPVSNPGFTVVCFISLSSRRGGLVLI